MTLNSTFGEKAELAVNSEKELNWLSSWRKSRIDCPFGERAE